MNRIFPVVVDGEPWTAKSTRRGAAACIAALGLAAAAPMLRAADWATNITTSAVWHDNASNADRGFDKISALQLTAEAALTQRRPLERAWSLHYGAAATLEAWPKFDDLNRASLGGRAGLRWKPGLGPQAPVVLFDVAADWVGAHESERQGLAGSLALSLSKRLTDAARLEIGAELARHDARARVFDRTGRRLFARYAHEWDEHWRFTLDLHYRDGDVVAYATPPRPDLVTRAATRVPLDTFGRPLMAYNLRAHTFGAAAGFTRTLNETTALHFEMERSQTARDEIRYLNYLVTVSWVRQL